MSNAITPVDSTPPANATRPQVKLPVDVLIQPIMNGPTKPPRLPRALMSAMAPAPAAPCRCLVGRVQKMGKTARGPAAPSVIANPEVPGDGDGRAPAASPQNPTNEAIAK